MLRTSIRRFCSQQHKLGDTIAAATPIHELLMPRPRGLPFFGTQLYLVAAGGGTRLHEYIDKRHNQLGSTFCENLNGTDVVFTSNPEFMRTVFLKLEGKYPAHILPEPWIIYNKMYGLKRGLFFMDGEEWLTHRRIMNKLVLRGPMEAPWIEIPIKGVTQDLMDNLKAEARDGVVTPDLGQELYRYSIDVIVSVLTGKSAAISCKNYDYLLGLFADSIRKIFSTSTQMYLWPSVYAKLNLRTWREFKQSVESALSLSKKLVKEITQLKDEYEDGLVGKMMNENLSEEYITRIIADFVIAAGDTTSYTLQWTLYLLAKHPAVLQELRKRDGTKYALCVVRESMRLYPVAPFLTRIIPQDCFLGPYKLKKGTPVVGSIYTSGRSSDYYIKPEEFIPMRWERKDTTCPLLPHSSQASLPFAVGSRSCVGRKIAQIQLCEIIKAVANNFDLKLINENEVKAVQSLVLVPKEPIRIQFKVRNS